MKASSTPRRRIGIWLRVSTDLQAQGDSPETHERRARDYAATKGWDVIETYRLDGVSGAVSHEHSEAKRMLHDIERGHITALVASKFARIARDGVQFRLLHRRFKAAKADLISLDEHIDTSTPAGELMLGLIADLAEWERKEIAARIRASVRPRALAGKPLGGRAPFGYQWVDKKLVPDPKEAPVRRLIHELYLEHRRKKTVAEQLNRMGHRTRQGKAWSGTAIDWLLRDPTAKGVHRTNYTRVNAEGRREFKPAEDRVEQAVEPVVPPEIWDRAHALVLSREEAGRRPAKRTRHLFAGFITCACGHRMYCSQGSTRFRCSAHGGCHRSVKGEVLEHRFGKALERTLQDADWRTRYLAAARELLREKRLRLARLEEDERQAKTVVQRAFDLYLTGDLPKERYGLVCEPQEARLRELVGELPALREEIAALESSDLTPAGLATESETILALWREAYSASRRAFLEDNLLGISVSPSAPARATLLVFPSSGITAIGSRTVDGCGTASRRIALRRGGRRCRPATCRFAGIVEAGVYGRLPVRTNRSREVGRRRLSVLFARQMKTSQRCLWTKDDRYGSRWTKSGSKNTAKTPPSSL